MDSLKVISEYAGDNYLAKEHRRKLKLLIELVEKQSKENESWKKYCDEQENDITLKNNKICDLEFKIEKQSKEIEELKEKNEFLNWYFENQKENFIHKDKIKEILGIEEDIDNEKLLSLLQTIVDENVRLEEIEDRKVQIEYNNVFNKGVKSVENKIKAKIEEKFLEAKGLYERGVQPQAQYTMKLLRDLEKSLLEKE